MAMDIKNNKLLPVTEYQRMAKQSEDSLTAYITKALQVLMNVGIVWMKTGEFAERDDAITKENVRKVPLPVIK
jgi:hypothetical protein